jgi:hypothetical protein
MFLLFIPLWIIFGDVAQLVVDFGDDPVAVNVAMSDITVQTTMTASGNLYPDRARFVTVPREQLVAAMAEAVNRHSKPGGVTGIRLVGEGS